MRELADLGSIVAVMAGMGYAMLNRNNRFAIFFHPELPHSEIQVVVRKDDKVQLSDLLTTLEYESVDVDVFCANLESL